MSGRGKSNNIFGEVIKIVYEARIFMPQDVVKYLNDIHQNLANPSVEYGIYMKGVLDKDNMVMIIQPGEENRYLPKQIVGPATLEFTEGPPDKSFNIALHRHPQGVRGFSGTDHSSINQDWDASILFIPPLDFPAAIINLDMSETTRFQVPAKVQIIPSDEEKKFMASIREKVQEGRGSSRTKPTNDYQEGKGIDFSDDAHTDVDAGDGVTVKRRPLFVKQQ